MVRKREMQKEAEKGAERVMAQEMVQGHVLSCHWTDRKGEAEKL